MAWKEGILRTAIHSHALWIVEHRATKSETTIMTGRLVQIKVRVT